MQLSKFFVLCILFFTIQSCYSQVEKKEIIEFREYAEIEKTWLKIDTTTKVINFWATWCRPCVKELPYFELLAQKNRINIQVFLVSLDKKQDKEKLASFISKREMSTQVGMLLDKDSNAWIDQVSQEWSGSIPATVIIKNGKKYFFEKEFESYLDLENTINSLN